MSRQQKITEQDARAACLQLQHEAETTGRQPSVLALSRRLGLANTTLRRRFPDICAEVAVRRAQPALPAGAPSTPPVTKRSRRTSHDFVVTTRTSPRTLRWQ